MDQNIDGFVVVNYSKQLKSMNLFSVYCRQVRYDLIKYWKSFTGEPDNGLSGSYVSISALGPSGVH